VIGKRQTLQQFSRRVIKPRHRPVSLNSQVCKMLESIVKDNMLDHIIRFGLIEETQHCFVKNRLCLTNLLEFLEYVSDYLDQGYLIGVIYLDFQKAFDKVPHRRLMIKVRALGIIGRIYDWIEDWRKDREQRVFLLGSNCKWTKVNKWSPSGVRIGPTFVSNIYK